jgi:hypothetical protein
MFCNINSTKLKMAAQVKKLNIQTKPGGRLLDINEHFLHPLPLLRFRFPARRRRAVNHKTGTKLRIYCSIL